MEGEATEGPAGLSQSKILFLFRRPPFPSLQAIAVLGARLAHLKGRQADCVRCVTLLRKVLQDDVRIAAKVRNGPCR